MAERMRVPVGLLEDILEAREFGKVKQMLESADTKAAQQALPRTPFVSLVREIEFSEAHREMEPDRIDG